MLNMETVPTLFPVQTDHPNIKPDVARIQSALITYLIECVLLEQWIKDPLIEVTTTIALSSWKRSIDIAYQIPA